MLLIDKLDGFEESVIEEMKLALEKLIEKFSEISDLSRLDFLYFPNDFDKAVLEFQIEQGMLERGSTNNEMGRAVGKTMEIEINGVLKDRIFLRKEILLNLFFGDENTRMLSMNTIHHELCHVHEHNDLTNMVEFQADLDLESNTLDSVLNAHAMNIFSEYTVPKMAVTTKNQNDIVNIKFITDIIRYTQEEMKKNVEEFQNGELEKYSFFGELQLKTGHLLKVLATTLGELDGLGELDDIAKEFALIKEQQLDSLISSYDISDCWLSLKSSLRKLDGTYPNWQKTDDIEPLKKCILQTWNSYGVFPDEYGITIHNK